MSSAVSLVLYAKGFVILAFLPPLAVLDCIKCLLHIPERDLES